MIKKLTYRIADDRPGKREQEATRYVAVCVLICLVNACENLHVKKGESHMQKNLWGEYECIDIQRMPRKTPDTIAYTPVHCEFYGHTWEYFGITGLKRCSVCQIKGYCPGCTPNPPTKDAKPFYCTKHTSHQTGSEGSA